MLHRATTPILYTLLILLAKSSGRPLAPQPSPSLPRRSAPTQAHPSLRPRSLGDQQDTDFLAFEPISLDLENSGNLRRSVDPELDEPTGEQSIDQAEAQAEKDWDQFVALAPDEDPDSYPDSFLQDPSCAPDSEPPAPNPSPSLISSSDSTKVHSPSNPHRADSGSKKSSYSGADNYQDRQAAQQQQGQAAKQKEADAAKQKEAEAAKQKQAEADKEKEAEADQEKKAEEEKEKKAEEEKEKKAEEEKKKAEEEKENKAEEEKKKAEEEKKKEAAQGNNSQLTDLKPIPGTSVTTGTAHKDHKDDSYSTPSAETHTGDATYYDPGLGACGLTNTSSDMIVAVSKLLYDSFPSQPGNPNTNQVCGKKIRASYQGRSCEVTVVDRCEGCDMGSLDFTIAAFEKLGAKSEGRLRGMTWTFI